MSELEIKPCPFCGGEAKLRQYPYCDIIRCENDGCEVKPSCGMGHDNADCSRTNELLEAWNARATRKPTDAVREFAERYERRIAELEAEVERLRRAGYEHGWHDAMAAKEAER